MGAGLAAILGLYTPADQFTFGQMTARALVVCVAALVIVRVAHRRFLAELSSFDAVVVFLLASTLARAINGNASFFPSLWAGFVIVLVHRFLAWLGFRFPRLGNVIKGRPDILIRNGQFLIDRLRAHGISREDVLEQVRLNGCVDGEQDVVLGTLERNGHVSVVLGQAAERQH
jgi:uncharacterized membrane protein YcaP (DUF421 family)